jgi:hypothetical protein
LPPQRFLERQERLKTANSNNQFPGVQKPRYASPETACVQPDIRRDRLFLFCLIFSSSPPQIILIIYKKQFRAKEHPKAAGKPSYITDANG